MKKIILFSVLFICNSITAQYWGLQQNQAMLGGGFGLTWIDGTPHYALRFFPEIQFSKIGVGLDLNFEFTPEGKLRSENFNEFSDYLSIIRYIRYGYKHDPLYLRVGALDYATLGHGSIMYLYNNSPTFDARKVGIELDIDFDNYGFESVYSNFGKGGVMGIRGYVRPLQFTELADIPVIGKFEIGSSIVTDTDEKSGVVSGIYDSKQNIYISTKDEGSTTIIGIDFGLPIIRMGVIDFDVYFDHTKIINFGRGSALGVKAGFKGLGFATLNTRFERRFNGEQYLPSYFNSLYEIERFRINKSEETISTKVQQLITAQALNGYFGELSMNWIGLLDVIGSFQKIDKIPDSGILHLWTLFNQEGFPYMFRAGYDKINIKNFGDLFKMDERSYLYAEFGYKLQEYLVLSMVYSWTYTPERDGTNNIIGYKTQKKVEPRISFIYPLNYGTEPSD